MAVSHNKIDRKGSFLILKTARQGYTYTHTNKHTHKHTQANTHTNTHKHTHTQTHTQQTEFEQDKSNLKKPCMHWPTASKSLFDDRTLGTKILIVHYHIYYNYLIIRF